MVSPSKHFESGRSFNWRGLGEGFFGLEDEPVKSVKIQVSIMFHCVEPHSQKRTLNPTNVRFRLKARGLLISFFSVRSKVVFGEKFFDSEELLLIFTFFHNGSFECSGKAGLEKMEVDGLMDSSHRAQFVQRLRERLMLMKLGKSFANPQHGVGGRRHHFLLLMQDVGRKTNSNSYLHLSLRT